MKDELNLALLKLIELFSWVIEFLIEFTAPGLILFYITFNIFPTLNSLIKFNNQIEFVLIYIIFPSILGIILYSFGSIIFEFLEKRRKLKNKVGNNIQEEYARIKFEIWDPHIDPNFNNTDGEKDIEFIKKYIKEINESFKTEFKNLICIGILQMSYVNLFHPSLKKEVKYTLSPSFIVFSFTLNILSILILLVIYSIVYSFQFGLLNLIIFTLPLIFISFLIYLMVEVYYKSYLTSIFNIWLSIGEASRRNK